MKTWYRGKKMLLKDHPQKILATKFKKKQQYIATHQQAKSLQPLMY